MIGMNVKKTLAIILYFLYKMLPVDGTHLVDGLLIRKVVRKEVERSTDFSLLSIFEYSFQLRVLEV